jgi:hypothetical protein
METELFPMTAEELHARALARVQAATARDAEQRQEIRRAQYRKSKQRCRAEKRLIHIEILLTPEEAKELARLEQSARDPRNFRKLALLQGAKFRANIGAGKKPAKGKAD